MTAGTNYIILTASLLMKKQMCFCFAVRFVYLIHVIIQYKESTPYVYYQTYIQ
jgi:hypothetical protein